jgi:hypothetical protein
MVGSACENIFIHSLFRTGSTYFWSVLRENEGVACYYEPLNEQLLDMTEPFKDGSVEADKHNELKHNGLADHYFDEYRAAKDRLKYLKKSMVADEFCDVRSHDNMKKYIDYLASLKCDKKTAFQFNRTALRSLWFRENYPDSLNIYIYRNFRDQWESMWRQHLSGNPYFLVMNYLLLSRNQDHSLFRSLADLVHCPDIPQCKDKNQLVCFGFDYNSALKYLNFLTPEEHYMIHYFLWRICYDYNIKNSDIFIDMTRLNVDENYRNISSGDIYDVSGVKIDFSGISLPIYDLEVPDDIDKNSVEEVVDNNFKKS